MKKDNIFSIVIMACGLLLVLSVFLPYVSYFSTTASLWKIEDSSRFIYILLGLFVIALYLINKKTEMAYLAAGYGTFSTIGTIISLGGFSGLSIAFYLLLLSSITIGVLTFLYNEEEADALINLSVSVNKPVINNNMPMNNMAYNNQMMNQNNTQMNMVQEPVQNNIQNTVMDAPVNKPVRFDPMTGEPIYQDNN